MHLNKKLKLFFFILIFLISSCKFDRDNKIYPRLPIAKNYSNDINNDSCFFSISIYKDDSTIIADNVSSCFIKNFSLIDSFVCNELKSGRIDTKKDYPIVLYIDSMTSYAIVDRLIEELQLIGFNMFYFRTYSKGFQLSFPEKEGRIQEELIKLYGQRFENKRNIINSCLTNSNSYNYPSGTLLPPPPPPPPFIFSNGVGDVKRIDTSEYCFVGVKGDIFTLNRKLLNAENFRKEICKKKFLYITLNKNNIYKDLIKIIDLIIEVRNKRLDDFSLSIYKSKYVDLKEDEKKEIKSNHALNFLILNFAIQNYIDDKNGS